MSRMNAEMRRQELIEIAFGQFVSNGYEKTSIRSIVGEAGGEIGMFYHHFTSKDDIFHAVLEEYNKRYVTSVQTIITDHKEKTFWEVFDLILCDLEKSLKQYSEMNDNNKDVRILQILHQSTLSRLVPCFSELFHEYQIRGEIEIAGIDTETVVSFVLYGISAVIHMKDEKSIDQKHKDIEKMLRKLFTSNVGRG